MTTAAISKVKQAVRDFEAVALKYRDYGACDTEPDGVWQRLLMRALAGEKPEPPNSGNGWDLYASSMDCDEAASALFDAADAAIKAVEECPVRDAAELREYLQDYCWRYF